MHSENEKMPAKPAGRRYTSVDALLRGEGVSQAVQEKVSEFKTDTRVALHLAKLRQGAGITQEEMAKHLQVTQGTISKLESGRDEDITLKEIREYARITSQRIGVVFGKPLTHTEAIKIHAAGLKYRLESLAEIANQNDDLQAQIKSFFGEAFFNLFNIIASCNDKLPSTGEEDVEIRVEVVRVSKTPPALALRECRRQEAAA